MGSAESLKVKRKQELRNCVQLRQAVKQRRDHRSNQARRPARLRQKELKTMMPARPHAHTSWGHAFTKTTA
eukprot:1139485-Pelagomonas_calceolata.AAC.5